MAREKIMIALGGNAIIRPGERGTGRRKSRFERFDGRDRGVLDIGDGSLNHCDGVTRPTGVEVPAHVGLHRVESLLLELVSVQLVGQADAPALLAQIQDDAAVLADVAEATGRDIVIDERAIPVNRTARAAAEMLGLDLLDVACEGRVLVVCAAEAAGAVLAAWRQLPEGRQAAQIGTITARGGQVVLETAMGGHRLVDVPQGEMLPRIC
jgi:hypothetical protein